MIKNSEILDNKLLLSTDKLNVVLDEWRKDNKKTVFTNGCFDILHSGHVEYLVRASEMGDKLIIGLNTDNSVKRLKGQNRPVNDELSRAKVLASLFFIDAVCLFDEDTPLELIKAVKPDILVKGGDYKPENIVGFKEVTSYGGVVMSLDFIEGFSSTDIINKLKQIK